MMQIWLGALAHKYGAFQTAIARENPLSFGNFQPVLMVKKNYMRLKSATSDGQMLYRQEDLRRGHDRGNRGWKAEVEVDEVHNSLILCNKVDAAEQCEDHAWPNSSSNFD